ncbi:protein translocase subunit SecF [Phytomonospora endophytica]|uniref:Protein-export membrane protein SecF n=1 Tax=Phytomonospora endophytica TaxID=714109 RepID=A0A841F907_9ACTN|nr:protein translocase subunit SecF [Phytomonospora endophytica]MBB6032726.1 preprotein translocase subunit SecF [Phytomonospora endophytica]GIG66125.1 protein-export membrane protein SecF [Phytomonospora endophytica]
MSDKGTPRVSVFRKLYRGDTHFNIVGRRKTWYVISAVLLVIIVASMAIRGFNLGVEFAGGNQFTVHTVEGVSLTEAEESIAGTGAEVASSQTAGTGADAKYVIKTGPLDDAESQEARAALAETLGVDAGEITVSEVSSSWGKSVSRQALIALGVFLVFVAGYLWLRFERKMAIAALIALAHDVLLTAGVFSIVGFEVTPGTVVGLLTILGYSLYDTVVVFDRVQENTRGLLGEFKSSYAEAANKALNETLMRSINTSIIGLLPVAGLLFVGVGILGVGTLKDLALVLFVGMLTGAYSSIFLATPSLVDLKYLEPRVREHDRKVHEKRRAAERKAAASEVAVEVAAEEPDGDIEDGDGEVMAGSGSRNGTSRTAGAAPRPGARPDSRKRRPRKP